MSVRAAPLMQKGYFGRLGYRATKWLLRALGRIRGPSLVPPQAVKAPAVRPGLWELVGRITVGVQLTQ